MLDQSPWSVSRVPRVISRQRSILVARRAGVFGIATVRVKKSRAPAPNNLKKLGLPTHDVF